MKLLPYLAVSALLLTGCDDPEPPKPMTATPPTRAVVWVPLVIRNETWKHMKPGCKKRDCAWVEADLQRVGDPALDGLLEAEVASLTSLGDNPPVRYDSLAALEQAFWPQSESSWNVVVQSRVLYQSGPLLTVELGNETYTGGAHGISQTRYRVLDRSRANKRLGLTDVLLPGQEPAFWRLVQEQHAAWLKAMDATDADFSRVWPFVPTDNFALTVEGVTVKYQNYDLGPYAFGQPELKLSRAALAGVIKPEFLK